MGQIGHWVLEHVAQLGGQVLQACLLCPQDTFQHLCDELRDLIPDNCAQPQFSGSSLQNLRWEHTCITLVIQLTSKCWVMCLVLEEKKSGVMCSWSPKLCAVSCSRSGCLLQHPHNCSSRRHLKNLQPVVGFTVVL